MPDFHVIANVSETVRSVLEAELADIPPAPPIVELHDLRGDPGDAQNRVTVFLYELIEDPSARNRPRPREPQNGSTSIAKPRSTLLLRYLITPWSPSRDTDQILLGRVVQYFHNHPIIAGPDLVGQGATPSSGLGGSAEALKVTMAPITLEDRTRIWHTVELKYRLSLTYEVRVVNIDVTAGEVVPVIGSRNFGFGSLGESS